MCDRGGIIGDRENWVRYTDVTPRPGDDVCNDAQSKIDLIKNAAKRRSGRGKGRETAMLGDNNGAREQDNEKGRLEDKKPDEMTKEEAAKKKSEKERSARRARRNDSEINGGSNNEQAVRLAIMESLSPGNLDNSTSPESDARSMSEAKASVLDEAKAAKIEEAAAKKIAEAELLALTAENNWNRTATTAKMVENGNCGFSALVKAIANYEHLMDSTLWVRDFFITTGERMKLHLRKKKRERKKVRGAMAKEIKRRKVQMQYLMPRAT